MFVNVSVLSAQKLRIAYTAFAGTFTILWLGKEAGLYQKYGADMDLLYIGSSTRAVQALLGGDVDIVYSAAGAVVDANLAGADLMMVGCQYDTGQTSFFTTPPITGIAALKGKAVGVSRFGAFSASGSRTPAASGALAFVVGTGSGVTGSASIQSAEGAG